MQCGIRILNLVCAVMLLFKTANGERMCRMSEMAKWCLSAGLNLFLCLRLGTTAVFLMVF